MTGAFVCGHSLTGADVCGRNLISFGAQSAQNSYTTVRKYVVTRSYPRQCCSGIVGESCLALGNRHALYCCSCAGAKIPIKKQALLRKVTLGLVGQCSPNTQMHCACAGDIKVNQLEGAKDTVQER